MTNRVLAQLKRINLLERIVSIVSDGAAVEWKLHNLLRRQYSRRSLILQTPHEAFEDVDVQFALIDGHPVVFPIDAKHTSKNAFNAHGSGARVLTLGDHLVTYSQLLDVIAKPGSPLYKRDVHNRDRQDDQAMERYLSAPLLKHVVQNTPEKLGLIAYLFIFGKLHSAVQNWCIPHTTRTKMLMTVEYFLQGWLSFTKNHPDYGAEHFLPQGFYDIVKRLIRACLGLITIFRDKSAATGKPIPLLLWRHMTEALEHFFGNVRHHVKEFDAVQFCEISKKVLTLINLERESGKDGTESRTRLGYQHTHQSISDIDLTAMATYPTDLDMRNIALTVSPLAKKDEGMYADQLMTRD